MSNLIIFLCWPLEIQWNGCLRALLALYFYMLFYIYISLFHFIMWWYEHWILPETCAPGKQQWLRIPTYLLYPGEWLSLKITLHSCILRWKLFPFLSDNSCKTQGWLPCLNKTSGSLLFLETLFINEHYPYCNNLSKSIPLIVQCILSLTLIIPFCITTSNE